MSGQFSEDNARAMLNSAQQERLHWSAMITTLMGFAVLINVGIWSYFLSEYIKLGGALPSYILIASAVSALTLGGWRLYTHYIDNQLAALYPELLLYEAKMSVPSDLGVSGYLIRNVPHIKPILEGKLSDEKRSKAIAFLAESKRIGHRGHRMIDLATLFFIILTLLESLVSLWRVNSFAGTLYLICFIGIVVGLALTIFALSYYQKNPSTKLIDDTLENLTK